MIVTKELLQKLYIVENKNGLQVSKELGIPRTTLGRYLDKFDIKRKPISQVMTGKKLSESHRLKVIKTLRNGQGKANPNWKGGRVITDQGYIKLKIARGYDFEHRLVIQAQLGRKLKEDEEVHHLNGIKTDNREENLIIVSSRDHQKIHWADDNKRKERAILIKKTRANKFWSTRKKV